jgi:hypothetical protein
VTDKAGVRSSWFLPARFGRVWSIAALWSAQYVSHLPRPAGREQDCELKLAGGAFHLNSSYDRWTISYHGKEQLPGTGHGSSTFAWFHPCVRRNCCTCDAPSGVVARRPLPKIRIRSTTWRYRVSACSHPCAGQPARLPLCASSIRPSHNS